MLAQNFKTPAALNITDADFEALLKVLGMLERCEIPFQMPGATSRPGNLQIKPAGFNMAAFYAQTDCGTVHCIAGWAEIIGGLKPFSLALQRLGNSGLFDLFEVHEAGCHLGTDSVTTTEQAAIALRNYLTTGSPQWREVLASS